MSIQTIGTLLVALGLVIALPIGMRGELDGWLIVPTVLVIAGLIIAIVGRKPSHPV